MEKLELKHLAPYLAYELKCCLMGAKDEKENPLSFLVEGGSKEFVEVWSKKTITDQWTYEDVFPILRPLSDLTQLIEINGKNIIPFLELYKISIDEDVEEYKIVTSSNHPEIYTAGIRVLDSTGEYKILSFSISNGFATQNCGYKDVIEDRVVELTMNQSQLWEKLLEWHFDVFSLIEKGLAIDINTLSK